MSIVCLGGGIGATRLWRVLSAEVGEARLTVVVNTADDLWRYGLRVCPDIDTVIYGLSGRQDTERGWGVRDESFRCMDALRELGEDAWFNLGDRDLATHLFRTGLLQAGMSLSEVTARLAAANGVEARIVPMSDSEVTTEVRTADGQWLHFQEFLVQRRAAVAVSGVRRRGIEEAWAAPAALEALASASLVVIGPSSPVASVLPILGVGGMCQAIERSPAPVVAVSPVVSRVPITDPAEAHRAESRARLLRALPAGHTATAVARLYAGLADRFVLDTADAEEADEIAALGMDVTTAPTLVHLDPSAGPALAAAVLAPLLCRESPVGRGVSRQRRARAMGDQI